jgi:AcrR family transcriptional regulator
MKTLNKQQIRTRETLSRLLDAAEEIFVRDGFDGAQLDEIAATAGRSKGAVYNHFKSKEDLFLALFEHRTEAYVAQLADSVRRCTTPSQGLDAFRAFCIGLVRDKAFSILTLEFKLYALRHPESTVRFRKVFELSKATGDAEIYELLFGKQSGDTSRTRLELAQAAAALPPIISSLILESNFEPELLSDEVLRQILGKLFDALYSPPTEGS